MTFAERMAAAAADPTAAPILRQIARHLATHAEELATEATGPTVAELAARAQLAELAAEVAAFRAVAEHDPNFAALPSDHPARRLFRAHERIRAADRETFGTVADRVLRHATRDEKAAAAVDILNRRACRRPLAEQEPDQ